MLTIFVTNKQNNQKYSIQVPTDSTVLHVKQQIELKANVKSQKQRLIFNLIELDDT